MEIRVGNCGAVCVSPGSRLQDVHANPTSRSEHLRGTTTPTSTIGGAGLTHIGPTAQASLARSDGTVMQISMALGSTASLEGHNSSNRRGRSGLEGTTDGGNGPGGGISSWVLIAGSWMGMGGGTGGGLGGHFTYAYGTDGCTGSTTKRRNLQYLRMYNNDRMIKATMANPRSGQRIYTAVRSSGVVVVVVMLLLVEVVMVMVEEVELV